MASRPCCSATLTWPASAAWKPPAAWARRPRPRNWDLIGKFKIVSMDRDDGTLKFIEDGVIQASVAQKTALMSYLGTKFMYYKNHAPVPVVADNKAAGISPDAGVS